MIEESDPPFQTIVSKLGLFGLLEDGKTSAMAVRVCGFKVGESDGWFHWDGLCVIFPDFKPECQFLQDLMPEGQGHLIVDFYAGHGATLVGHNNKPYVHQSFQLADLFAALTESSTGVGPLSLNPT